MDSQSDEKSARWRRRPPSCGALGRARLLPPTAGLSPPSHLPHPKLQRQLTLARPALLSLLAFLAAALSSLLFLLLSLLSALVFLRASLCAPLPAGFFSLKAEESSASRLLVMMAWLLVMALSGSSESSPAGSAASGAES